MEYISDTFCSAPWFQIRKNIDDEFRSCCEIDIEQSEFSGNCNYKWPETSPENFLNSEYVQYLRQNLNQGVKLPECQKCWNRESVSQQSLRQITNNTVTNNQGHNLQKTWLHSYFKQKNNYEFDYLLSVDIKVQNLCNFSCIMCGPEDSSQIYSIWKNNQSHPVPKRILDARPGYLDNIKQRFSESNYEYLDAMLDLSPSHVKLLGGEPLIDKKLLEKLIKLDPVKKSKISLLFVTNGSVDLIEHSQLLTGYKQVNYVVSLDGIGPVQDYIRRGSDWKKIEDNILKWNSKNRPVDIAFTLQCFNAMHFPELYKWCQTHSMKFTMGIVQSPNYLSVKSIPPGLREKIFAKYQETSCWSQSETNNFKQLIDSSPYEQELLPMLSQFVGWYDESNHWKDLFPEWSDFLSQ